jgi:hypothetical protein
MMKTPMRIYIATLILGVFSSLAAQSVSSNHLDANALDALRSEKAKWWAEVQDRMRDSGNPSLKMEMVQYVLSRSSVWKEDDPRDSETRSAILMLAEDVAVAIQPSLSNMPDSRQIVASEKYRSSLLAALNPSPKNTTGTAKPQTTETTPAPKPPPVVQPPAPKKTPETRPALMPSEAPASSPPWSIIAVLIVAAIGLLWLLLKNRK